MRGRFVTFEGMEGVGKSTQLVSAAARLRERGFEVVATREPGGTRLAEALRRLILDPDGEPVDAATELLMLFAARASHVTAVIRPALARGCWVLCDRFTDATEAYQGHGRGMALEAVHALAGIAHPDLAPDLTILLDAPVDVALARLAARSARRDRIETEERAFFERVRNGYLQIARREPARVRVVDAAPTEQAVAAAVGAELDRLAAGTG